MAAAEKSRSDERSVSAVKRFPDHARVVFIGDSITAAGTWIAHIYDYYLRNFPWSGIRMFNSGISGTARFP